MIAAILTIIVAMLVYIFWYIRIEVSRLSARIDESALGIARMNREMMGSVMKVLTQPLLPGMDDDEDDDEDDDGEEHGEEEDEGLEEQTDGDQTLPTLEEVEELDEVVEGVSEVVEENRESDEVVMEVPVVPPKRGRKKST